MIISHHLIAYKKRISAMIYCGVELSGTHLIHTPIFTRKLRKAPSQKRFQNWNVICSYIELKKGKKLLGRKTSRSTNFGQNILDDNHFGRKTFWTKRYSRNFQDYVYMAFIVRIFCTSTQIFHLNLFFDQPEWRKIKHFWNLCGLFGVSLFSIFTTG